jgi:hypothetical protein
MGIFSGCPIGLCGIPLGGIASFRIRYSFAAELPTATLFLVVAARMALALNNFHYSTILCA